MTSRASLYLPTLFAGFIGFMVGAPSLASAAPTFKVKPKIARVKRDNSWDYFVRGTATGYTDKYCVSVQIKDSDGQILNNTPTRGEFTSNSFTVVVNLSVREGETACVCITDGGCTESLETNCVTEPVGCLSLEEPQEGAECFLVVGGGETVLPFPGGEKLLVQPSSVMPVRGGEMPALLIPSNPSMLGMEVFFQAVIRNPRASSSKRILTSNALCLEIGSGAKVVGKRDRLMLDLVGSPDLGHLVSFELTTFAASDGL